MRPFQRCDAAELVEQAMATARQQPRTRYRLGVSRAGSQELIGSVQLIVQRPSGSEAVRIGYRSAEVGIALRADEVSIGHSVEIGYLLGVLGFDRLHLHRMWASFMSHNETAQRAAEESGMVREGVLRHHGYADGTWHDIVQYSILEEDWAALLGRR